MLTDKQQRFVDEYLIDLNATQAAIRAGYSEKTARSQGQRLLTNVDIKLALSAAQEERSERTKIDAAWVLQEAARSYAINATEYIDAEGRVAQVNPQAARGFLELAGKHVGVQAFKERVETETTLKVDVTDISDAVSDTDAADAYLSMLRH